MKRRAGWINAQSGRYWVSRLEMWSEHHGGKTDRSADKLALDATGTQATHRLVTYAGAATINVALISGLPPTPIMRDRPLLVATRRDEAVAGGWNRGEAIGDPPSWVVVSDEPATDQRPGGSTILSQN